jgi:glycosyltransferase involved in cell wall biosynthesis
MICGMAQIRVGILSSTMSENSGGAHTLTTNLRNALIQNVSMGLRDIEIVLININPPKATSDFSFTNQNRLFEEISLPGPRRQKIERLSWLIGKVLKYIIFREKFDPFLNRAVSINRLVLKSKISVIWSLEPLSCPLEVPYINTVWDIAHRTSPYFPEVSSGNEWAKREKNNMRSIQQAYLNVVGTAVGAQEISRAYGVSNQRILINPFPVLNTEFKKIDCIRTPGMFFYPAQFWPHKNHATLLRAISILKTMTTSPLKLILTGSDKGNLEYIRSLIDSLDLNDEVEIEGFVSRRRIIELYSQCGLFVFPSLIGPDNLPPLEAVASGAPLLVSRIPGHIEQLGEAAKYFDPLDALELAVAMKKSIENPEEWRVNQEIADEIRLTRGYNTYISAILDELNELVKFRKVWA